MPPTSPLFQHEVGDIVVIRWTGEAGTVRTRDMVKVEDRPDLGASVWEPAYEVMLPCCSLPTRCWNWDLEDRPS